MCSPSRQPVLVETKESESNLRVEQTVMEEFGNFGQRQDDKSMD